MGKKIVLVDWEGTIADEGKFDIAVEKGFIEKISTKYKIDLEEASNNFHAFLKKLTGSYLWFDYRYIADFFGINDSWVAIHKRNIDQISVRWDLLDYLQTQKKNKNIDLLCLATNSCEIVLVSRMILLDVPLMQFDFRFTSDRMRTTKNNVIFYEQISQILDLSSNDIVITIGDNEIDDIKVPQKLGFKGINFLAKETSIPEFDTIFSSI